MADPDEVRRGAFAIGRVLPHVHDPDMGTIFATAVLDAVLREHDQRLRAEVDARWVAELRGVHRRLLIESADAAAEAEPSPAGHVPVRTDYDLHNDYCAVDGEPWPCKAVEQHQQNKGDNA